MQEQGGRSIQDEIIKLSDNPGHIPGVTNLQRLYSTRKRVKSIVSTGL